MSDTTASAILGFVIGAAAITALFYRLVYFRSVPELKAHRFLGTKRYLNIVDLLRCAAQDKRLIDIEEATRVLRGAPQYGMMNSGRQRVIAELAERGLTPTGRTSNEPKMLRVPIPKHLMENESQQELEVHGGPDGPVTLQPGESVRISEVFADDAVRTGRISCEGPNESNVPKSRSSHPGHNDVSTVLREELESRELPAGPNWVFNQAKGYNGGWSLLGKFVRTKVDELVAANFIREKQSHLGTDVLGHVWTAPDPLHDVSITVTCSNCETPKGSVLAGKRCHPKIS